MITLGHVRLAPYALSFGAPLVTAGGAVTHRRGWHVAVVDGEGRVGHGDAAVWPGFGSGDAEALARALGGLALEQPLDGAQVVDVASIGALCDALALPVEGRHAVELALLDLLGQARGVPVARLLWEAPSGRAASHVLYRGAPTGAANVKIKLVGDAARDEARVAEARAIHGPRTTLRLDAAGRYGVDAAMALLSRLARYDVALVEQPVAAGDAHALARVRAGVEGTGIAIAADEGCDSPAALEALLDANAVDAVVLKPMFLGGLLRARDMAERARACGVTAIVTHALESAIGRAGAVHLACGLDGVHGLGDSLAEDVASLRSAEGCVHRPLDAGLGVAPRAEAAARPSLTIPHPLGSAAASRPSHPALVDADGTLDQHALLTEVTRAAGDLARRGVGPGHVVALVGARDRAFVVALHAIGWLGAIAAPIDASLTAEERDVALATVAADLVVDAHAVGRAAPAAERFWSLDAVRLRVCTSGSTGTPRAVDLTTAQIVFSAFGSALRLGHDPEDAWLCCLPLHHVGGLSILFRAAFYGTTVLLHDRFDPARVAASLDAGDATHVSLVPAMLERVLDARDETAFPKRLRAILLGGAACPAGLLARAGAIAAPVALTWGMTEAASQVATRWPGDTRPLADAGAGHPLAFARIDTREGRLVVRGPVAAGGELVTGDRGRLEAGVVHVEGRADDIIISGGENLSPREIESVLERHPSVEEAVVVGLPSRRWGARPWAAMTRPPGATPVDTATLRAWCSTHLSAPKVPEDFLWCDALPKTALGKIARARVAALWRAALAARDEKTGEGVAQGLEQRSGLHGGQRHEDVLRLGLGADDAVGARQGVAEGHGALAEALDGKRHRDAIVESDGGAKIGLGVHERHAEAVLGNQGIDAEPLRQKKLFVGGVAVLEHASEEHDASTIHLAKASSHLMNEGHDDGRR